MTARTDDNIRALEQVQGLSREDLEALAMGLLIKEGGASHRILECLAAQETGFLSTNALYRLASNTGCKKTRQAVIQRLKESGYIEHVLGYKITLLGRKALLAARPLKKRL